jgi:uroporphyrinogen-III synthase
MRVIVTRPGPQAGTWVNALRAAGLDALALPLIEIGGPPDPQAVLAAWQRIDHFEALMFVSANAVEQFFALRPKQVLAASLQPYFFVTGPGSVAALRAAGVPPERIAAPDAAAAQFDSEALWAVVRSQVQSGWRVLIVRGDSDSDSDRASDVADAERTPTTTGVGRDWFSTRLLEQGASVEFLVAYARRAPVLRADLLSLVQRAAVDGSIWLFSSSEAVRNLSASAAGQSWHQARALATHPRIAEAARAAGFARVRVARPALADLIASIESLA